MTGKTHCRRAVLPAATCVLLLLALLAVPAGSPAHGGYPLSLGATSPADLDSVTRLVLVYLREGVGMTVAPLFFARDQELAEAYRDGKVDLLVALPDGEWRQVSCRGETAAVFEERRARYFSERFPRSWSSAFAAASSPASCGLSLAAHPRVAGDLRFSLLQKTLVQMLRVIDGDDIAALLRAGGREPRSQVAAARALLRRKGLI